MTEGELAMENMVLRLRIQELEEELKIIRTQYWKDVKNKVAAEMHRRERILVEKHCPTCYSTICNEEQSYTVQCPQCAVIVDMLEDS